MLSRVLAENHLIGLNTHRFGGHNFIGGLVGKNAVLMNSRLVSKGICADDGFIVGGRLTDNVVNKLTCTVYLLSVDPRKLAVEVGTGMHCHYHLFEGGVTCTLTETVYGTFDLKRSAENSA